MQIIYSPNPVNLAREAVWVFLLMLQTIGEKQSTVTVGLSGGTSLLPFYETLRNSLSSVDANLRQKIRFAFLDERFVPLDHSDSNYRLLSEVFFTPLLEKHLLSARQILPVRTDVINPTTEYSSRVPQIDIGLFGAGPDGHIASLFPNHPWLRERSEGYILVHDSPKPPSDRISVSVPYVQYIPSVFVFFIGEGKWEAYRRFLDPNINREQCPAKYLLGCKECVIVTDLKK